MTDVRDEQDEEEKLLSNKTDKTGTSHIILHFETMEWPASSPNSIQDELTKRPEYESEILAQKRYDRIAQITCLKQPLILPRSC